MEEQPWGSAWINERCIEFFSAVSEVWQTRILSGLLSAIRNGPFFSVVDRSLETRLRGSMFQASSNLALSHFPGMREKKGTDHWNCHGISIWLICKNKQKRKLGTVGDDGGASMLQ